MNEEPRFEKPTTDQIIEIAILFNNGKVQKKKLADMTAMAEFIIDRLYDNGTVKEPSFEERNKTNKS